MTARVLRAMGRDLAAIHRGIDDSSEGDPADLKRRKAGWLCAAAGRRARAVEDEFKTWKEHHRRLGRMRAADPTDQENALLRRPRMGQSLRRNKGETPCPAHPSPTSAAPSASCTNSGCWVIPNPWDVGSARYLQGLGFKALASTSSGYAWSVAHADNAVGVDMVLAHLKEICAATDVPVNADFEGGYADDPAGVATNVTRCCETGVAGLSIEDSTGNKDKPLYDIPFAVERMKAARAAIDKAAPDVLLTGRAEGFISGVPDLEQMIARLKAYADAGADVLYAPGIRTREQIEAV